jgi:putative SOS response-associated peptidase YedK
MCGRFTLATNLGVIAARFGVARFLGEDTARYNIALTKTVVIVSDDSTRHLTQTRWGLMPS